MVLTKDTISLFQWFGDSNSLYAALWFTLQHQNSAGLAGVRAEVDVITKASDSNWELNFAAGCITSSGIRFPCANLSSHVTLSIRKHQPVM